MLDVFTKLVLASACIFTFACVVLAQRRTIKLLSDAYLRLTQYSQSVDDKHAVFGEVLG